MRRVERDFTFRDGTCVPAGNWVLMNQKSHMVRSDFFDQAHEFNGRRFAPNGKSMSRLTKATDPSFTFWGSPRLAWYGAMVSFPF